MKRSKNKTAKAEKESYEIVRPSSISLIFFLLDQLSDKIYYALCNGFFGKIFTAYSSEQRAFDQCVIRRKIVSMPRIASFFKRIREYLAQSFETSFFLAKLNKLCSSFLTVPLRSFGVFFVSFGTYTTLIFFLKWIAPNFESAEMSFGLIGVFSCILGFPMMLSRKSIAGSILESKIANFLLIRMFGFRREALETKPHPSRSVSNVIFLSGMVLGLLTFFVHPLYMILGLASVIGVAMLFSTPEFGILLAIFLLPFLYVTSSPSIFLGLLIFTTAISYVIKIVRGKRLFKMEIIDITILAFGALILCSGITTAGGISGYNEVLMSGVLIFGYFLTVNLMRTQQWLKRCTLCIVFSGTLTAILGIFQYLMNDFGSGAWLDLSYFSDIRGRVDAMFENPNVLATYLVIVFPFALALMARSRSLKERILYVFSVFSIVLCTVLTWSRGAWIGLILGFLLFAMMHSKKTLRYLFLASFFVPFLSFLIPASVSKRFMSIGNLADSSSLYRVYTWKGSCRVASEHFWGGIGYGTSAYREIYPQYAYAGIEAAEHSHNLGLQVLIGLGIGGLLLLGISMLLFFQMNLEHLKQSENKNDRSMIIASVAAIAAILVMGCFDFVWYNHRVFFMFWFVVGLSGAYIRLGKDEIRRQKYTGNIDANTATVDLSI